MARNRGRSGGRPEETSRAKGRPRTVSEGITVHAVSAASGRPATTVHVEVDPERIGRQVEGAERIEEVVAEIPNAEGDQPVRWEEQRLAKTSEELQPGGERTVRYTGTHYDGCEAGRYGVGVRVRTPRGDLEPPPSRHVREADKPGDGESPPDED